MFWSAVVGGLSLLLKWRVWVAILILTAVHFGLHMALSTLGFRYVWRWPRLVLNLVSGLEWLIRSFINATVMYTLFPILIGVDRVMPLWAIVRDAVMILWVGLIAGFAHSMLSYIPLVGSVLKAGGLALYFQSAMAHSLYVENILGEWAGFDMPEGMYPSLGAAVGFLILGIAIHFIVFAIATLTSRTTEEDSSPLWAQVVATVCSYLPVFMYTEYVRLALYAGSGVGL